MSSLNGDKIFITGATGFVGSNLVRRALQQGAEVYVNVRNTSNLWRIKDIIDDIAIINADITQYEKLIDHLQKIRPNIIFHTAVYGGSAHQNDFNTIIETNIIGTANVVRCCKDINFDLFVNTGSSSEYGIKQKPMRETDLLEPVNDYGVSKASATMYCRSQAINKNLPIVTLRLFSPYGMYEERSRLIPSVIISAICQKNPKISSLKFVRDFIFIDDVLSAYEALIDHPNSGGQIYNIGSGEQHTIGEITEIILRLLGNKVEYELGVPPNWKDEPDFWQADMSKTLKDLNWAPKYDLNVGLTKSVDWFKKHQHLYH
jgi:nucleoside-diphosphate-sugar epimerase